ANGKMTSTCRMMDGYVTNLSPRLSELKRYFGDFEPYRQHFPQILELRLAQLKGADAELKKLVLRAVQHLDEPDEVILFARDIGDRAMEIIWRHELPDRLLPTEWIEAWKFSEVRIPDFRGKLPKERGLQAFILRLGTGTRKTDPVCKSVTRSTAALVNFL